FNNCFKNGILPIVLDEKIVDALFNETFEQEGYQLTIDLEAQKIVKPNGEEISFDVDEFRRHCLLNGLDDIGLTLQHADEIRAFEAEYKAKNPWLFAEA
ncbi:MAG: 3-isopropylmalate dehydratase small subunit, partial [Hydrogenovibrio sp.]|nr:3-isopropylmalate dehydratase small subunit [Hydrogenovibrio sp.]